MPMGDQSAAIKLHPPPHAPAHPIIAAHDMNQTLLDKPRMHFVIPDNFNVDFEAVQRNPRRIA
jgi:hypothetical protein